MPISGIENSFKFTVSEKLKEATSKLSFKLTSLSHGASSIMQSLSKLTPRNKVSYGYQKLESEDTEKQIIKYSPTEQDIERLSKMLAEYGLAIDSPILPEKKNIPSPDNSVSNREYFFEKWPPSREEIKILAREIHKANGSDYMSGSIFISDGFTNFLQKLISKFNTKHNSA